MDKLGSDQRLDRRWVTKTLLARREDALVIAGCGSTVWDCTAVGDGDLTFPLWNAMGSANMVGLGLALAQPARPVLVITGDGELMMQLGCLATIAAKQPKNLSIVVIDNEVYQETGGQPTHTQYGTSITGVATACGFPATVLVTTEQETEALAEAVYRCDRLLLAQVKVSLQTGPRVLPPRDGSYLKDRFRRALLGPAALE
ncbi:MAG: aldehyde dehydrogenase [Rhodospirillales bacterium]|nr:aldehyde dehydrogenase [Rhodospirillales bacterium]